MFDDAWAAHWRKAWDLTPGVTYLNHGSFGPPPKEVQEARRIWQQRLDAQPMEFFCHTFESAWYDARRQLAEFLHADAADLVFVENATAAMNVVAASFSLTQGDEVLLTDHEYGAVQRIWKRATSRVGAEVRIARLPEQIESVEQVVDAIFEASTDRTRLLIVSHITSATAITMPVEAIAVEAKRRGIAICIDGPHAPAQVPIDMQKLKCDYYCASCHKWLSAPFGSGFLCVNPERQSQIQPPILSWGRLLPERPSQWSDEFVWTGTRDPSPYLSVPAAIDFLKEIGLERFRQQTHELAREARQRIIELTGLQPIVPDDPQWYGCMAHVPLPPGDARQLQLSLRDGYAIEAPVIDWNDRRWIRVSCHLYNRREDIELLVSALTHLLGTKLNTSG